MTITPSSPSDNHLNDGEATNSLRRNPEAALAFLDADHDNAIARLKQLLRIPSVSADPRHNSDVEAAAAWVANDLESMGFSAKVIPTAGKPLVMADNFRNQDFAGNDLPHLLFYGHYDVQPPDPLDQWNSGAFDPQILGTGEQERIVARGACDDKGQMMSFFEAFRAWVTTYGSLPCRVTVVVEGEEEVGSLHVKEAIAAQAHLLNDVNCALVCDTEMWDQTTPAITTRLRGLLYEEITVTAANRDLHSGLLGGIAQNANRILTRVLGKLHDDSGRVTIPGFYDGIISPEQKVTSQWEQLNYNWQAALSDIGLSLPAGENAHSPIEQLWMRPSADINGICGGYTGVGSKTVIPASATGKVSFRLVPGQDPAAIQAAFREWVASEVPADCSVSFNNFAHSPAITVAEDSSALELATKALTQQWSKPPVMAGCGASIPIVEIFSNVLNIETILIGFALPQNGMHSPNENYTISSFRGAARSWVRILGYLSNLNAITKA